nr:MAG TPA: hypothetical protein [Bacteriophage sp.]
MNSSRCRYLASNGLKKITAQVKTVCRYSHFNTWKITYTIRLSLDKSCRFLRKVRSGRKIALTIL